MVEAAEMTGRFTDAVAALRYVLAGEAYFTVRSAKTGTRFTFHVSKAEPTADNNWKERYFVKYLFGPENTSDYAYLGIVRPIKDGAKDYIFHLTRASKVGQQAPVTVAFDYVLKNLAAGRIPEQLEIWHEGRCGVCGRPLTVPESIESGIGPVCARRGLC